ncbi:MAG: 3-dehydroquinate synthase [Rhodobacter sp.]|jgi:3-dehydroquinate synthase|tara:strand:- start:2099 stop:3223 length:1125 start_codon:yes stop_codon:yes gene_type:complete
MTGDQVAVLLGDRSYDVVIEAGLTERVGDLIAPLLARKRVAIVTDDLVAPLHLETLQASLDLAGIAHTNLILPHGESTKNWPCLTQTVEWLLEQKIERRDIVIAFGGGVIGDLVGFAAAILRRGVRFVQIPTTLLAQVDSSVGGKTGINSVAGKNLIGAFHQPSLVLADIALLDSLSKRDFLAGYGEVVKYGLLGNIGFYEWLEKCGPQIALGDHALRQVAVTRSVQMKADIVGRDETEEGERALLNLGHTFCHALEKATGYGERLLHGEGVAIGCVMALELSQSMGLVSQESPSRLRAHLRAMGTKVDLADISGALPSAEVLLSYMAQDKKVIDGRLRFILNRSIGQSFVADDVPAKAVLEVLNGALTGRGDL